MMSFLDGSDSDSDIDEKPAIQLFSHASRQAPVVAANVTRTSRGRQSPLKKDVIKPKKTSKRKSKDREPEDEFEDRAHRRSPPAICSPEGERTPPVTRSRRDKVISIGDDVVSQPEGKHTRHTSPVKVLEALEVASPTKAADVSEAEDTDDEFAEIARQARLEQRSKASKTKDETTASTFTGSIDTDPKVEIFITSPIPGTQALRVFLRLSQRLGMVREAWCKRQDFAEGTESTVYLTYCKRQIYDASTPRSLGLAVDAEGRLYLQGRPDEQDPGKVHLEAVSDAVLAELEQQQASPDETNEGASNGVNQSNEGEQVIRIVLRARGADDFKLRVKPTTSIAKISFAYRRKRGVPDDQQVVIAFDGEDLLPEQIIGATDISDLDVVEVHLR